MDTVWFLLLVSFVALLFSDLSFTKKKVSDLEEKMEKLIEEKNND